MKVRKKCIMAVVLAVLFTLSASIPLLAGTTSEPALCYDVCCTLLLLEREIPVLEDGLVSEDDWVRVDSKLCIHLPWGLDILYERVAENGDIEQKWVCYGIANISGFSAFGQCYAECCNEAVFYSAMIEPHNNIPCNRTGCNGTWMQSMTTSPRIRSTQRICLHLPWGVDVLYSWLVVVTRVCNGCGAGDFFSFEQSNWACYGFR